MVMYHNLTFDISYSAKIEYMPDCFCIHIGQCTRLLWRTSPGRNWHCFWGKFSKWWISCRQWQVLVWEMLNVGIYFLSQQSNFALVQWYTSGIWILNKIQTTTSSKIGSCSLLSWIALEDCSLHLFVNSQSDKYAIHSYGYPPLIFFVCPLGHISTVMILTR